MAYILRNVMETDKSFIYGVKKASIYDYVAKIWGWNEEYQVKDFETDFNLKDFKIITSGDEDIGFIQIYESESNINITEIHIVSKYQGFGIGSSIIKNITSQAACNGKTVTIGCFIDNTRARSLYERLGFKVIKKTDTHYAMKYSAGFSK